MFGIKKKRMRVKENIGYWDFFTNKKKTIQQFNKT